MTTAAGIGDLSSNQRTESLRAALNASKRENARLRAVVDAVEKLCDEIQRTEKAAYLRRVHINAVRAALRSETPA